MRNIFTRLRQLLQWPSTPTNIWAPWYTILRRFIFFPFVVLAYYIFWFAFALCYSPSQARITIGPLFSRFF